MLSSQFNPNIKIKSESSDIRSSIIKDPFAALGDNNTRYVNKKKRPVSTRDVYLSHINLSKNLVGRHYFLDHDSVCRDAQ